MPAKKGNQYARGNKGGGRPTAFKAEYVEMTEKLCLLGATDKDLANFFDVSEQTINDWKKKHEDFSLALKNGKTIADANVASRLYNRALGYSHKEDKIFNNNGEPLIVETTKHYPPDATSAIFWLKNRQKEKWRDKNDVEMSGNITQVTMTPEEYKKARAEAMSDDDC